MNLNFDKYANEGKAFINDLARELGYPDDKNRAARVLRAVLHAVRDLVPPEASVHFLSQLPFFLKGVYADQWSLKPKTKRMKHRADLAQAILEIDHATAAHDFESIEAVEDATGTIFLLLARYISEGELEKFKTGLPKEMKMLLGPFMVVD